MKRAAIAVLFLLACGPREAAPPAAKPATTTVTRTIEKIIPSNERRKKENDLIHPTSARFLESAKIGGKLGADGRVAEEVMAFKEGAPIYFTLNLRESPVGLQTHAIWLDDNGKELARELRQMNGAKSVTFSMTKKLAPGFYHVDGYWGGNFAAQKTFQVVER